MLLHKYCIEREREFSRVSAKSGGRHSNTRTTNRDREVNVDVL